MTSHADYDPKPRRASVAVDVGGVIVGGGAPVVVQSMTNTDTADIDATVKQVMALARAGSELVRITVDREEAAAAVPYIKERLLKHNVAVPLVGDFHFAQRPAITICALSTMAIACGCFSFPFASSFFHS